MTIKKVQLYRKLGSCMVYKLVGYTGTFSIIRPYDVYSNRVVRNSSQERVWFSDLIEVGVN